MDRKELAQYLLDEDIVSLEFEDTGGNTTLFVDLDNITVADIDNKVIRLQEV